MSHIRRAADDYGMIKDGDRIAVGISGGKDSLSLLVALQAMKRFYPAEYELEAVTVSLGFVDFDVSPVRRLCDGIGVRYTVKETDIGEIIFGARMEPNPCSLCSRMRKGALHDEAVRLGCNKVALGHNRDDAVQTFFMSMFYNGTLHCFSPVSYLDRKGLTCIRPLVYVPERDVVSFVKSSGIEPVKSPCPADGYTKREEIKGFINEQRRNYDRFDEKVFGALKRSGLCGWQPIPRMPNR